jgi:hypothetical protein
MKSEPSFKDAVQYQSKSEIPTPRVVITYKLYYVQCGKMNRKNRNIRIKGLSSEIYSMFFVL